MAFKTQWHRRPLPPRHRCAGCRVELAGSDIYPLAGKDYCRACIHGEVQKYHRDRAK